MEMSDSDDQLPPGWTVEVRVRKNGRRDKYYILPSTGLKFKSKVEVFRHLDNASNKVSIQKISPNVVVEKASAEGLPPGWVKKTRIATKGDTVRRDTYYIDPVSGYTFHSTEDAYHYLESGEIRKNTLKPKDGDNSETNLKDDKSPSVTMKPTLSISMAQSSNLDMLANYQQSPRSASSGEHMHVPNSKFISNHGMMVDENLDQKEVKVDFVESASFSGCTDKDTQEKQLQESSETKQGTEKVQAKHHRRRNKHKKQINLPRRSSKRLAGIKLDPVPELKTRNRTRRAAVKQSSEEKTITNMDKSSSSLHDGLAKQQLSGKDKECFTLSPPDNNGTVEECMRVTEDGDKVDANLDYSLDFPLKELLTDPCIAFAIQTLTGLTFETSKNSQTSELKDIQHSEISAASDNEGQGKKNNVGNNVISSPVRLATPQEHAGDNAAKTDMKAKNAENENASPSSEKTLDMSWMDPCIEFAIKTLTDSIPLESDPNPKNCLQQQLSSSSNQHSERTMSNVSLNNTYQTDYYCSQYFGSQKPMFKQSFVDPSLKHTRNIGIGNSAGARLSHCGEGNRRNVC
ncbi:methyl-CpG-binding domain-containing protein 13 isoform X1 [Vigna unguiculata]|uniref:methyl-CpG-binding domain-containing protein 13 isoform X1 n=1 Tax=Vigna unguiculata TaxID=3917 RepID=UPI0010166CCC|nr:methyl-CpG-binding domain-containing protein 13 isoform X1 [Vigna unguiculata]